jgi:hypothetical protein
LGYILRAESLVLLSAFFIGLLDVALYYT